MSLSEPMIECIAGTVIDQPDQRVINRMSRGHLGFQFDPVFLKHLGKFHGGTPANPFFKTASGTIQRIATFLNLVDDNTPLSPPIQESKNYFNDQTDARISDYGIEFIVDCDVNGFFDGQRLMPFAALFTPDLVSQTLCSPLDPREHLCLIPLDDVHCNALCFDRSTSPHSVVLFDAAKSNGEQPRYWDDGCELNEICYDAFIEFVADSFGGFTKLLTESSPSNAT